jgi:hypothetical protein
VARKLGLQQDTINVTSGVQQTTPGVHVASDRTVSAWQEEDRAQARAKADLRAFMAATEEHQAAKHARKLQDRAADRAFMVHPSRQPAAGWSMHIVYDSTCHYSRQESLL